MTDTITQLARRLVAIEDERAAVLDQLAKATQRQALAPRAPRERPTEDPTGEPRAVLLLDRLHAALLAAPTGLTIPELATAMGITPKSVRATLTNLKSRGRAVTLRRGLWGPA